MNSQDAKNQELTIAENQIARMTIVIEESDSLTVRFAAEELARYLNLMTGAKFPIEDCSSKSDGRLVVLGKRSTADGHGITFAPAEPHVDSA